MKKNIFPALVVMSILFIAGSAFAHINKGSENYYSEYNEKYNNYWDYINGMHNYIINQIDNSDFVDYMNNMHNEHMNYNRENRGYMISPSHMPNYGINQYMNNNQGSGRMDFGYGRMMQNLP